MACIEDENTPNNKCKTNIISLETYKKSSINHDLLLNADEFSTIERLRDESRWKQKNQLQDDFRDDNKKLREEQVHRHSIYNEISSEFYKDNTNISRNFDVYLPFESGVINGDGKIYDHEWFNNVNGDKIVGINSHSHVKVLEKETPYVQQVGENDNSYGFDEMMVPLHIGPKGGERTSNRADETSKVSPFDDVPGFKKNSLKRTSKKKEKESDLVDNVTSLDKVDSTNHKEGVPISTASTIGRNNWIKFEENTEKDIDTTKPLNLNHQVENILNDSSTDNESNNKEVSSPTRKNWVLFEPPSQVVKVDIQINDELQSEGFLDDMSAETLLNNDKESKELRKSIENLLNVVNKTVSSIKDNITKSNENIEEKFLFAADDDAKSEISDEVISLDYESEEENKKLRNTPIKKFTDVSLFQASCAIKNEKSVLTTSDNLVENEFDIESLMDYPMEISSNSWEFWYRYPDRRKKVGSRSWVKVKVVVEGEFIRLTGTIKNGAEILKEIPLHPFFVFTIPTLHKGDKDGNVQSVKLQYVKYVETRRLQKGRWAVEHLPSYTPVLKIASRNILELKEFIVSVETIIRNIPTYRDKGITYRYEEIFVDCDDECQFSLSGDGNIVRYNITVHMRLRVFVTGNPELKLFLNDIDNKEILSKTKKSLLRETKPPTNWINPRNFEYHPCVDELKTQCEKGVIFSPPDGCSFELLRFRVKQKAILPLTCKSSLELLSSKSIRIHVSVQVTGDARTIRHKRNDVKVYFPIPLSWGDLFVKSRTMKGLKQYVKVKGCKKASSLIAKATNYVTIQANAGEATYDPSFGAIIWRLGCLPLIHGGLAADATHSFQCQLELTPECEPRDKFQKCAYVEFNISQSFASGVSIEEILLSDGKEPDKWVCYRSNYLYKIDMKLKEDGKEIKNEVCHT